MKLLILSDLHLEFHPMRVPPGEFEAVVPVFVNDLPADCFDGVDLWVHGHTHDSFDYPVDRPGGGTCRVVCNPRGYVRWDGQQENRGFDPGCGVVV